ncbi:MAG: hypothetical protein D6818_01595 [Bacteroidetes bacterium]|nr:MAG: hypothetical protein D6818_01595 [Bacteroidota bacterium]
MEALGRELGFPWKACSLDDAEGLRQLLEPVDVVLHAAGPFMFTARPMIEACIDTGTHYLDITGEIGVFEMAARLSAKAAAAGIMLMPGTGFDVVPTDCLAVYLKQRLPDATHLQLAFMGLGGVSHGTATTMVQGLGEDSLVRENGQLRRVPLGHKTLQVPFRPDRSYLAMTIPWGDIATAWYSTGIPNIETYMAVPPAQYRYVRLMRWFGWLLRQRWVKRLLQRQIDAKLVGPSDEERARGRSYVWGRVRNAAGDECAARLETLEGYTLTAISSILIAQKVLAGNFKPGFQTPAMAYGPDLILEIPDTKREDL